MYYYVFIDVYVQHSGGYVPPCCVGHFNAVRQARTMGDRIVVGINSDEEVAAVKGCLPVYTEVERGEIMESCKWVDKVVLTTPYEVDIDLLDSLGCDICAHGDDVAVGSDGKDCYEQPRRKGRLKAFKRTEGMSTTHLMSRLLDTAAARHPPLESLPPNQQCITSTKRLTKFIGEQTDPKPTDRIVYVDGSFDIFHVGHVRILNKAKTFGDYLIVGVHDDPTVRRMKGPGFPVVGLLERTLSVLAMNMVDEVIVGAPLIITEYLLKMFRIGIVVRGTRLDSWCGDETGTTKSEDPYDVPKRLGIYREVESSSTVTTREIIQRIQQNRPVVATRVEARMPNERAYVERQEAAPLVIAEL
eukprot:GHVS01025150.1.p1 GENE.GHVS01025150.1~~GHVS01025150.1.p1  ORF type:complete len:358 (+),score=65.04 GHVS01025150.1:33-1106(+)